MYSANTFGLWTCMLNIELEIRESNVKDTSPGFKMFKSSGRQLWFNLISAEVKSLSSVRRLCDSMDCSPRDSPGQNTRVGSLSLLQGIFPTQDSNPGLPRCRQANTLTSEPPGKPGAKWKQIWDVMAILEKFMQTMKCSRESKKKQKKKKLHNSLKEE